MTEAPFDNDSAKTAEVKLNTTLISSFYVLGSIDKQIYSMVRRTLRSCFCKGDSKHFALASHVQARPLVRRKNLTNQAISQPVYCVVWLSFNGRNAVINALKSDIIPFFSESQGRNTLHSLAYRLQKYIVHFESHKKGKSGRDVVSS